MTSAEQSPIPSRPIEVSGKSVLQERMAQAGPEDIHAALHSEGGYWDDFDSRSEQFSALKDTLDPSEAERQQRKLASEQEQAQGMTFALDAWKTYLLRGQTTDPFEVFVASMSEELGRNADNGVERAKESAKMFGFAEAWNMNHFRKTMKDHYARQDAAESASGGQEQETYVVPTEAERQAQAVHDERVSREREAEETRQNAQRETLASEARESMESALEQSELTAAVVAAGKGQTFVHANFKRGFDDLGDMDPADVKRLHKLNQVVRATFGTDRMPAGGWREANAESVLFMPVVEQEYRTEIMEHVEKKSFGRSMKTELEHQVLVPGSEHQKLITNPETGQQEPAVLFRYDFDGGQFSGSDAHQEGISYQEYSGGRTGSFVQVAVELPQSVADKLLTQIKERPVYVREVVKALIMGNTNGQVEAKDWVDREHASGVASMKPPYKKLEELAPDWAIAIATPKPAATIAELAGLQAAKSMEVTRHRIAA